jgi:DNA-binding HxlR family transcriptional regulator
VVNHDVEPAQACGLARALEVIQGKWKPTLIWELHERPLRFGELRRRVPGLTEKVLTEQLRQLQAVGVVHRQAHDGMPPAVTYSLTAAGAELNAAVHALAQWGRHLPPPAPPAAAPALPEGVVRVRSGVRVG